MADARRPRQQDPRREPTRDATRREGLDPGAFVGRQPERQAETIPGGVSRKDERISAVASQPGEPAPDPGVARTPEGHREGTPATDDAVREAGQNR
jgi:hypothetical protein